MVKLSSFYLIIILVNIILLNGVNRDLSFNEICGDIPFSISKLKELEFL